MEEVYDPSVPIYAYFKRIDDEVQYADEGKVPFSEPQVLQTVTHTLNASGSFPEACKDWQKKPETEKTYTHFNTFFTSEYHYQKETSRLTQDSTPYSSNATIQAPNVVNSIENLSLEDTNDLQMFQKLLESNKTLTDNNQKLTKLIADTLVSLESVSGIDITSLERVSVTTGERPPPNRPQRIFPHTCFSGQNRT